MPETTTPATELTSQYITQVSADLERNVKEQGRIGEEIASLQEQLAALQHDHAVLVTMQHALGITETQAEPAAQSENSVVPSPRRKAGTAPEGKQKPQKSAIGPGKTAAKKQPTAKTTGPTKTARPTLVELIRRYLSEQTEPRSAAEVASVLGLAQPERSISTKVVRITLEGLVAKSQAERTKQGKSVFYTAPAPEPTAAPQVKEEGDAKR